jgi:hypothetical protein
MCAGLSDLVDANPAKVVGMGASCETSDQAGNGEDDQGSASPGNVQTASSTTTLTRKKEREHLEVVGILLLRDWHPVVSGITIFSNEQ